VISVVSIPGGERRGRRFGPFELGRTPVTNAQYAPFVAAGLAPEPPWFREPAFASPGCPVVGVTWEEAKAFAAWLSDAAGGGSLWRLPTEAEWEHAMAAGVPDPPTPWGSPAPPAGEIPEGILQGPWETGRGTPNPWGVLDPGTVVHEWCADDFVPDHGDPAPAATGPPRRSSRGGSWRHRVRWSKPSARSSLPPGFRYSDYGFRVLRPQSL
jgi:formylglycine-generating enzyme